MPFKVQEVFAFLMVGDDGDEAVPAVATPMGMMPMVAADKERLDSLREAAKLVADSQGKRVVLARFHLRHDVEFILPGQKVKKQSKSRRKK